MQKLFFLVVILTSAINVAYSSFPVNYSNETESIQEMKVVSHNVESDSAYPILSLISSLFGYGMLILAFAAAYVGSGEAVFFLVIAIIAMLGGIVFGLLGLSKEKWFSILGFLLGLFGLLAILGSP